MHELTHSRAKMKKWSVLYTSSVSSSLYPDINRLGSHEHMLTIRFEKWQAEKMKRKDKGLPAIVDYRDETYVSGRGLSAIAGHLSPAHPNGSSTDAQW